MLGNHVFVCPVERRDGTICGEPADDDMPVLICTRHALKVYRRMHALITARLDEHMVVSDAQRREAHVARKAGELDVVYYVRLPGDLIKIGTTGDMFTRLRQLPARPSDLLAAEPGGRDVERKRHLRFGHLRVGRTERFRAEPDLLDHVEQVRRTLGVPTVAKFPDNVTWSPLRDVS